MSGTSQITPRGQLTSFCLKTARGVVAAKQSLLHCQTRRWGGDGGRNEWHIHQTNCQTIVCFLLRSSEYRCWTRPAEVPGLHFPSTQYRCRISQACTRGVLFFSSTDSLIKPPSLFSAGHRDGLHLQTDRSHF